VAAVVAVAAISGCAVGSGSGGGSDQGDQQLDTVQSGSLTFAMSGQYRPFNYYNKANKLVGFDVEIGDEVSRRLGLKPNPVTGPFNTLLAGLVGGRYDAIIGSMADTPEREKQADFSKPYYSSGAELFVAKDSKLSSVKDLHDATVGVALGTTFEEYARKLAGVKKVSTYQADIQALREVENGRLDAAITSKLMGLYEIKQAGIAVKPVGDELYPDAAAIPVAKGNDKLLKAINKALADMKADGTYQKISEKWFGQDISG
jgi:polar amino acid transport system substrate-binding protein